jgi:hypothetical protein
VALPDREAAGTAIGATRRDGWLYLHVFGVPEAMTLDISLPEGTGEVLSVTQTGGTVSDWSVTGNTLHLTVPQWADTAVQTLCVETKA